MVMLSLLARISLPLALLCALGAILSGLGYRWGWWSLNPAFKVLEWSAYGAAAASVLAIAVGAVSWRGGKRVDTALSVAALIVGLATFGVPGVMLYQAHRLPPIHDITTDTQNPPRFVAVLPLRADARNSPQYAGPVVAEQQRLAYPDIVPFTSTASPDKAFSRALKVARDMGWTIVAAAPAQGRIEAVDRTLIFGFRDDVVIRITPAPQGSVIDVRSESRVGESDIGTNARRIRRFLAKLSNEP
jgi:uncharacterized protein (DUF1499 family)